MPDVRVFVAVCLRWGTDGITTKGTEEAEGRPNPHPTTAHLRFTLHVSLQQPCTPRAGRNAFPSCAAALEAAHSLP